MQGHTFSSTDISFTGWFMITALSEVQWTNFFRFNNLDADCIYGTRILCIFHNQWYNRLEPHYQTTQSTRCSGYLNPAFLVSSILGRWMYVTESVTVGPDSSFYQHCYGIFGEENIWYCPNIPLVAGQSDTFGASSSSFIAFGITIACIIGHVADSRYYLNSALSTADFTNLYIQRSSYCTEYCQTCLNPFQCDTCLTGFYLSNGQCPLCNSCCTACTGPGKATCSACAAECQFIAPSTCVRCGTGCVNCDQSWHCLTCGSGFYLEFYSSNCVINCPTGFTPSAGQCLPHSLSTPIVDFTFNQVAKLYISTYFTV